MFCNIDVKRCPVFSIFNYLAWHFAVILSFAFRPVPYFHATPCQKIQPALLRVTRVLNVPWPKGAIASTARAGVI